MEIIKMKNAATGFISEFKTFAMKGNVIDMAVGVIIGAAFGKIVSSLVADIVMPLLSLFTGNVDFTKLAYTIREASEGVTEVTINYGQFLQVTFDFLIVALAIFIVLKKLFAAKKEPAPAPKPAAVPEDIQLLREIRDSLAKKPVVKKKTVAKKKTPAKKSGKK